MTKVGIPYAWGQASDSRGYDCSGLTRTAFAAAGVSLPRTSSAQYRATASVPLAQLRAGDLVFWSSNGTASGVYHVGIYAGDGEYIHASTGGGRVMRATFDYFAPDFAKRVIE